MELSKNIILFLGLVSLLSIVDCRLKNKFKWSKIAYKNLPSTVFVPAAGAVDTTYDRTAYIPDKVLPVGMAHYNNRIYVSLPRYRHGVPATLAYIDLETDGSAISPQLNAFPSWEANTLATGFTPNDNKIISVFRTWVDECGRLWALDTGLLDYPGFRLQIQRPAIIIYNLATGEQIKRFPIPADVVLEGDGVHSITVDVDSSNCANAYAYLPDINAYQLMVYSLNQNKMWTFKHNSFHIEPRHGNYLLKGVRWQWKFGVSSGALTPKNSNGDQYLYYHSISSYSEWRVNTKVLKNELNAARTYQPKSDFEYWGTRKSRSQSNVHVIDKTTGVALITQLQKSSITCWHPRNKYTEKAVHTVHKDSNRLVYPSDIQIDANSNVWVLSNRLPIFLYGTWNASDWNFRLYTNTFSETIKNAPCFKRYNDDNSHHHHGREGANEIEMDAEDLDGEFGDEEFDEMNNVSDI